MNLFLSSQIFLASISGPVAREFDDPMTIFWNMVLILFFVLLNGFFVAAEFAIVKVRTSQLETLGPELAAKTNLARHVTGNMNAYLSLSQLGITVCSLVLGALGEPYIGRLIQPVCVAMGVPESAIPGISFVFAISVVTFFHITIGEQVPKTFAIRKSLATTLAVSRPLKLFYALFKPAIWILNSASNWMLKVIFKIDAVDEHELVHSAEELRMLVEQSESGSEVTETERDILINALELNDLVVRDIMTPRSEVVCLDVADDFKTNFDLAVNSKHTRFPLVEGHLDNSLGLIHVKDLLRVMRNSEADLMKIKRDMVLVPEMMPLDKLLKFFLNKHAHLALAVDEFGGAVGIVMLDNVIEELVGDIQDEFDVEEKEFHRISETEFLVEGTLGLYELEDHDVNIEFEEDADVSTVGGYITHLMGQLPNLGDETRVGGYRATVAKTDGKRVVQVRFKKLSTKELKEEDEEEEAASEKRLRANASEGE